MQFEQKFTLPVDRPRAWQFLMDIPALSTCMPGVQGFEALDDRTFTGAMVVKVGPISINMDTKATIETRDDTAYEAVMSIQGNDRRIGGAVRGKMGLKLREIGPAQTEVNVATDVSVLGKIGQFGFSIMKKKADDMLEQFASRIRERLA